MEPARARAFRKGNTDAKLLRLEQVGWGPSRLELWGLGELGGATRGQILQAPCGVTEAWLFL